MREIKFRAWITETEQMIDHNYINVNDFVHKTMPNGDVNPSYCGDISILMQYTGLKDKNGIEIYESDIVTHEDFKMPSKVTFERGCFRIHGFTIANFEAIHHMGKIEVIGNIYEK